MRSNFYIHLGTSKAYNMIWVQLSKAEGLLKNGTYTNKFILSYVLFISIFQSFAINLGTKTVDESKWLAVLFIFSEILINILGIYHLFKINQEGDKKDFLNRYVVLGFVVGVNDDVGSDVDCEEHPRSMRGNKANSGRFISVKVSVIELALARLDISGFGASRQARKLM